MEKRRLYISEDMFQHKEFFPKFDADNKSNKHIVFELVLANNLGKILIENGRLSRMEIEDLIADIFELPIKELVYKFAYEQQKTMIVATQRKIIEEINMQAQQTALKVISISLEENLSLPVYKNKSGIARQLPDKIFMLISGFLILILIVSVVISKTQTHKLSETKEELQLLKKQKVSLLKKKLAQQKASDKSGSNYLILIKLSSVTVPAGLWLEEVSIEDQQFVISGYCPAENPEVIYTYLNSINKISSFGPVKMQSMEKMENNERQLLKFKISGSYQR